MDANKLKVLREIGYTIQPSCETCSNSDLSSDGWGYCGVHTYEHLKHNEDSSFASVHRLGTCSKWERDEKKIALLGLHAFHEFMVSTAKDVAVPRREVALQAQTTHELITRLMGSFDPTRGSIEASNMFDGFKALVGTLIDNSSKMTSSQRSLLGTLHQALQGKDLITLTKEARTAVSEAVRLLRSPNSPETGVDEACLAVRNATATHVHVLDFSVEETRVIAEALRNPPKANALLRAMLSNHVFVEGERVEMIDSNPVDLDGSRGAGDPPNGTLGTVVGTHDLMVEVQWDGYSEPITVTRYQVRTSVEIPVESTPEQEACSGPDNEGFKCPDELCLGLETQGTVDRVICERCQAIGCDLCILYDMMVKQYICDNCYFEE